MNFWSWPRKWSAPASRATSIRPQRWWISPPTTVGFGEAHTPCAPRASTATYAHGRGGAARADAGGPSERASERVSERASERRAARRARRTDEFGTNDAVSGSAVLEIASRSVKATQRAASGIRDDGKRRRQKGDRAATTAPSISSRRPTPRPRLTPTTTMTTTTTLRRRFNDDNDDDDDNASTTLRRRFGGAPWSP